MRLERDTLDLWWSRRIRNRIDESKRGQCRSSLERIDVDQKEFARKRYARRNSWIHQYCRASWSEKISESVRMRCGIHSCLPPSSLSCWVEEVANPSSLPFNFALLDPLSPCLHYASSRFSVPPLWPPQSPVVPCFAVVLILLMTRPSPFLPPSPLILRFPVYTQSLPRCTFR